MEALAFSQLFVLLHLLTGVLLPGFFLSKLLKLDHSRSSTLLINSIATGLFLGFFEFGAFYLVSQSSSVSTALSLAQTLPIFNSLMCFIVYKKYSISISPLIDVFKIIFKSPGAFTCLLFASAYGTYSYLRVPYALDNVALERLIGVLGHNGDLRWQGTLSYLSTIFFPASYLYPAIPITTIAAALKIPLCWLCMLIGWTLVSSLQKNLKQKWIYAFAFFALMVLSFHGVYGMMDTAKETVFSIAFLILFSLSLLQPKQDLQWMKQNALYLAVSFSLGAVTIPYSLVLIFSFLIFKRSPFNAFKWFHYLSLLTLAPMTLNLTSLAKLSPLQSLSLMSLLTIGFFILSNKMPKLSLRISEKTSFALFVFILTSSIVACSLLLPVKHPIMRPPLDGESSFWNFLIDYDHNRSRWITFFGFIGLFVSLFNKKIRSNPGYVCFALFPFLVLSITLSLAYLPDNLLPIHGQHLWDLIKDIPNWWLGYYFAFYCLFLCLFIQSKLKTSILKTLFPFAFFIIIFGIIFLRTSPYKLMGAYKTPYPAHFFHYGGYTQKDFGKVIAALWPEQNTFFASYTEQTNPIQYKIFYCNNTSLGHHVNHFRWYGFRSKPVEQIENIPNEYNSHKNLYICSNQESELFKINKLSPNLYSMNVPSKP